MSTLGWILILAAIWVVRAVFKGQVIDDGGKFVLLDNLNATIQGVILGEPAEIAGTGDPIPVTSVALSGGSENGGGGGNTGRDSDNGNGSENSGSGGGSRALLLTTAVRLGQGKPYVFGAAGPRAYDCSGLVWDAMRKAYPARFGKLRRFTTFTLMRSAAAKHLTTITADQSAPGDIVLWNTHIGIVSGPDRFYSARNPRSGIGYSKISSFNTGHGNSYKFLRVMT